MEKPEEKRNAADGSVESSDLLAVTVARFRKRCGEEIETERKRRDFFVGHGQHYKAGWNQLRMEGLETALDCMDVALSESPKTCHLQSANVERR